MTLRKSLLLLALFLILGSCKKGGSDPVLGRWVEADGDGWTEYFADGDVIFNDGSKSDGSKSDGSKSDGSKSTSGTWKRLDDGRIKLDTLLRNGSTVEVFQVSIEKDAAIFTSSEGKSTTYRRSGTVLTDTDVAEVKEATVKKAQDQQAQLQTVVDMRATGKAMFSWLTDQVGDQRPGTHVDLSLYHQISRAELESILVPHYAAVVPELDGWGNPYEYYLNRENLLGQEIMGIRSPGRDGVFAENDYHREPTDPADFDEDIVWADGFFARWPQPKQQR